MSASDLVGELAPPKEGSKIDSVFRAALYVTALAKFGDPPLIIQPDALPTHDVYTRAVSVLPCPDGHGRGDYPHE